jgi:hypothetical protein
MRSLQDRNCLSLPARGPLCAFAWLLAASLAAPPAARAGIEVEKPTAPPSPITQFLYPPQNVYVLAIGINHYKIINLEYSVKDTTAVSEAAARTFKNSSVHVVRLADAEATKAKIHDAIQQFALNSHAGDLFLLSFSGFTFTKSKNGSPEVYLAPSDTVMSDGCQKADCVDESSLISGTLLNSWMTQMHAQRQIILFDMNDTDKLIPIFENRWRKESCAVGPEASKRVLLVTNHGGGLEDAAHGGFLTWSFLKQLGQPRDKGINSAFRLQQGLYEALDPGIVADKDTQEIKSSLFSARFSFRAELLGGDFLIDGPLAGVKTTELLRDSGLGALCYSDPAGATRGLAAEEPKPEDAPAQSKQPTNYALVVASDDYKSWPVLRNPKFDATTIENDLATKYGFKVEHLWNPTRDQLRHKLDELHARHFNDQDQLFIFIAGHGDYDETNDIGYLVFPDTPLGHVYDTEMNLQELRQRIDTIPAKHIFLAMDSCFAGSLDPSLGGGGRGMYDPIPLAKLQQRTAEKKTRYFITSGGKEYVPDGTPGNHSPFASLFILALEKGSNATGYLNLSQLPHYFERLSTVPRAGNLGHNEDGADFFFVPITPNPNPTQ